MSCVGNDNDLLDITIGEHGAFSKMKNGAIFIDHTTVLAQVTETLYKKSQGLGISFIDAPISGGQVGAENGMLSIMCGGDEREYKLAEPILDVYSKICRRIGETGAGQKTKMCNQIAIAGLVQGSQRHFILQKKLDWMEMQLLR